MQIAILLYLNWNWTYFIHCIHKRVSAPWIIMRNAFRLSSIADSLICWTVPVQISLEIWCTSLSLWKDISAISALDPGLVSVARHWWDMILFQRTNTQQKKIPHWQERIGDLVGLAYTGEKQEGKLELESRTVWARRGGCPGAGTNFPVLMREVPHLFAWITDCFKHGW